MKIFNLIRPDSSCDYHRVLLPYKYLTDVIYVNNFEDCDLYIFNRFPHLDNETFLKEKKRKGFKYIIDLDDYWLLDKSHYLSESFINSQVYERTLELIKNADYVTVSTEPLYLICKRYNKKVVLIPNAISFHEPQFKFKKQHSSKNVKFGYSGGLSHLSDISILNNNAKLKGLDIDFTYLGYESNSLVSREIKESFPFEKIKTKPKLCLNSYMNLYNSINVSLVPLEKTFFNKCKSNLKTLEAGSKGVCVLTSKVKPYYNKLDKDFVIYANSKNDWYDKIKYLKDNKNFVLEKGMELFHHVKEHYDLDKINITRKQVIDLIENGY